MGCQKPLTNVPESNLENYLGEFCMYPSQEMKERNGNKRRSEKEGRTERRGDVKEGMKEGRRNTSGME